MVIWCRHNTLFEQSFNVVCIAHEQDTWSFGADIRHNEDYNEDVEDLKDTTGLFQEDAREEVDNDHLSRSYESTLQGKIF